MDQPIPGAFRTPCAPTGETTMMSRSLPWKRWIVPHLTLLSGSPTSLRAAPSWRCWAARGVTTPIDAFGYATRRRCASATAATSSGWLAPEPLR